MINKILNDVDERLTLSDREKMMFEKLKDNYYITDKLFYDKEKNLYNIKIIYKNFDIIYQLKFNRKIILQSKNKDVIINKIKRILNKKGE